MLGQSLPKSTYFLGGSRMIAAEPSAEVIQKVNDLIAKGFEIPREKLVGTASLGPDLGLDSLDAVDMLVYIEENMNVKVDGERLRTIRSLQDVYVLAAESMPSASTIKN